MMRRLPLDESSDLAGNDLQALLQALQPDEDVKAHHRAGQMERDSLGAQLFQRRLDPPKKKPTVTTDEIFKAIGG